jgi:hypothetical protein
MTRYLGAEDDLEYYISYVWQLTLIVWPMLKKTIQ